MKYIISESRLDRVVDAYLDSQFEPHEIVDERTLKDNWPPYWNPIWVVNHEVVAELGESVLFIEKSILSSLISFFSLTKDEAIERLKDYFNKKLNVFQIEFLNMNFNQTQYDKWRENNLL